jgi:UDP-N-acetyl-D-glucosamine dehydrogenase
VAYKRNIDDVRESPALDIIHLLRHRGAHVTYSDPYVPSIHVEGGDLFSSDLATALSQSDCAVIITDHADIDYAEVLDRASLVVDTRNALRGLVSKKIIRL